jgi:hypothetical protein
VSRRRGATLAELLVYLGLLSAGLLVIGGLEQGARRALTLQQSLIDIDMQATTMLGGLRRDVESARRLEVDRDALVVQRQDGRSVRYERGKRTESGGGLGAGVTQTFALNAALRITLEAPPGAAPLVVVEATFTAPGREGKVERTFRRTAAPRAEVGR